MKKSSAKCLKEERKDTNCSTMAGALQYVQIVVKQEPQEDVTVILQDENNIARKSMRMSLQREENSADKSGNVPKVLNSCTSSVAAPLKSTTNQPRLRYMCSKCKLVLDTKTELSNHFRDTHGGNQGFTMYAVKDKDQPTPIVKSRPKPEGTGSQSKDCIKKSHHCNICELQFDSNFSLYNHYKSDHDIDHPYLKNSKREESRSKKHYQCDSCGIKVSSKNALVRHRKNIHPDGSSTSICPFCGNSYRVSALANHEKTCSTRTPRRRQDCMKEGCSSSFYKKEHLIQHVKEVHKMKIEPMRTLHFASEEDFKQWKEEEEDRTYSYFSKHAGTKKSMKTFYCQHEGSERSHKSSNDSKQQAKRNKKGRIKKGLTCTSYLRASITDSGVVAYYYPTHSHPISPDDVKHQPLSKEIIQFIKEQIVLNVPCRQIQTMVKKRLSENPTSFLRRDNQVSLKRIMSMAQRYRLATQVQTPGESNNVPVETFNSFIDVLCAQENSPILLYQPPSDDVNLSKPNNEDHLFFLALQTADQQRMLQRETSMPMFISIAKADFTLQYYLTSIIVPCEKNFEYPVGHLISSQMNEEVISLFLQTIGERCPELNVNCIVSLECQELNEAIRKVFGADGPYFLSKWHFLETMRKEFQKKAQPSKGEEIFDYILAMADAESEDRFLFLYNSFKEQFEPEHPEIVSNFADYFVRASEWASCYRQDPGILDSCLYVDSFFNKLNKKYRRRPSKSLTLLPDLLLFLQESYRERRENADTTFLHEEMIEQHAMGLEISEEFVQEMSAGHWTVQASKHAQVFCVMQCMSECGQADCSIRCQNCANLCSHMYFCTCGKSESICLHVHRVYLLSGGSLAEPPDPADYLMDQGGSMEESPCSPIQQNEETDPSQDSEATRSEILRQLDSLRQVVDQRCVPEEMVKVIHSTLSSLCGLIDTS